MQSQLSTESVTVPLDAPTDNVEDVPHLIPEDHVVEYYTPESLSWIETIDLPLPSQQVVEPEAICPVQPQERARTSKREDIEESTLSPEAQPFYPETAPLLTEFLHTN